MNRARRRKLAKFARTPKGSAAILAAVNLSESRTKTRRLLGVLALAAAALFVVLR